MYIYICKFRLNMTSFKMRKKLIMKMEYYF